MPKTDIARRVYNHTWKLDPIVRSLLDTDFYKLLMLQMIWGLYPKVEATFSLINRKTSVRLADEIDEVELRAQLDHARTLRISKKEMIWLAGNSFYGSKQIFSPEFLRWLEDFQLPEYRLEKRDGHYKLEFPGPWMETTMWRFRRSRSSTSCARALRCGTMARSRSTSPMPGPRRRCGEGRAAEKLPNLRISDFGTRRRHSFLWQRWCVEALKEGLGPDNFMGTSNVLLAMDTDLEALGTNAHELPMVLTAIAPNEKAMRWRPYQVLQDWESYYGGNLLIVLPDTFGTSAFLNDAPDWVADWTGFRPDSAPEIEGGDKIIRWWKSKGKDPRDKLLIFSDGLDVDAIEGAYRHFEGKVRMAFGWGTNLTNDFAGCSPIANPRLDPISLVCKVTEANGRPAVKLSDNPEKATGNRREVERYLKIFGNEDRVAHEVLV